VATNDDEPAEPDPSSLAIKSEHSPSASGSFRMPRRPQHAGSFPALGSDPSRKQGESSGTILIEGQVAPNEGPQRPNEQVASSPSPEPRTQVHRTVPPPTGTFAEVGTPSRTGAFDALPSESSTRGRAFDPTKTGYYKPLPTTGRIVRLWEELGLRLGQRFAEIVGDDHLYLLIMAVVVGVTAGATSGLLLLWIASAVRLFPAAGDTEFGWVFLILAPMLGGLMVGGLREVAKRVLGEIPEGIPAVIEAVGQRGGKLKGPSGVVLGVGTGLTIASGGSVGHEGPTVAIGATVGSVLGRFFGLRLRRQVTMLGAGCAAGLASAFNAPLAGVLFTVEVVFRRSVGGNVGTMSVFTPLIVAAVAGAFTSHAIFGDRIELIASKHVAGEHMLLEMAFFLTMAVLAGLLSPAMSRVILSTSDAFTKLGKLPAWLKPAIGGLGVGLLGALLFTDLLGPGRGTLSAALTSQLIWQTAAALCLLKIFATALTIGSGGMGGVFMPSLVIGACLGTVVQGLAVLVIGDKASAPAAYALVGMGAYLGATLRAPLTPIVMIFELTGDYELILPLMFACILSSFVAGRVEPDTLFELMLRKRGSSRVLEAGDDAAVMQRGHVGDLMLRPDHMLRLDSSFDEVQRACLVERTPTLYLLDADERVVGFIDSQTLAAKVLRGEIAPDARAGSLQANEQPTLLVPDDTLAGAMMAFARAGRDVLPVVDRDRKLLGLIERNDLLAHYSENVLEQTDAELQIHGTAGLDHEVALGTGVTLERVIVSRSWAGRSLKELDLRNKVHVQVLEWRRGDELLEIDPLAPLREGDVLALAGNRENLLAARWVE
jgi:CIC family chloride channel protein